MSAKELHIREATRADIAYIAEVQARSAWGDEIYTFLAEPGRSYQQWSRFVLMRVRQRFVTKGIRYMVAVAPSTNQIVGFASLEIEQVANQENALAEQWDDRSSLFCWLELKALDIEQKYYDFLNMYGMSWNKYEAFGEASEKAVAHLYRPHMHCINLNILPEWQGKGVGSKLLRWAQDKAAENGMGVALQSSIAGIPVYRKLGFVDVGDVDVRLEENGPVVFHQPAMAWNVPKITA